MLIRLLALLASGAALAPARAASTVEGRIAPPPGFSRIAQPAESFGAWLRSVPLHPGNPDVRLHDGSRKWNQDAHHAVIDLDVGPRDLQQCADAVMRLRAEYLFSRACHDDIAFNFTSGHPARWSAWRSGERPVVSGNRVTWKPTAAPDASRASFRRYLDAVFTYAGSASLERELKPVADSSRVMPGDVFIEGGFPGHAVIVLDVAEDQAGQRVFLLAQSYMPAQDIHVLKSFEDISPWYRAKSRGELATPEWEFEHGDLRRFPRARCEDPN